MKIELPSRVTLTVNLGSVGNSIFQHFLDVFVTMPIPAGGTDGYCGDADGDIGDETEERVYQRTEAGEFRVTPDVSLFDRELSHKVLLQDGSAERIVQKSGLAGRETLAPPGDSMECESVSFPEAELLCAAVLPEGSGDDWIAACAVDVCAGGEDMLDHSAMLATQAEEIVEEELVQAQASMREPAVECHTCAPGDMCFNDVRWAMTVGIPSGHYTQLGYTPAVSESSCFEEVQAALRAWQSLPDFVAGSMNEKHMPAPCSGSPELHMVHGMAFCR